LVYPPISTTWLSFFATFANRAADSRRRPEITFATFDASTPIEFAAALLHGYR
jgi:hypothetical protein